MPKSLQQRARKKPSDPRPSDGLLKALDFVAVACDDTGEIYQKHCLIADKQVIAFNGITAAGHPIEEDVQACPHISTLRAALDSCGDKFSMTHLDNDKLSIVSGKFRANIQCVSVSAMRYAKPDTNVASLNDEIYKGFVAIGSIVSETFSNVVSSSLLLQAQTMVATTGKVIAEYYHGNDLPSSLLLPRSFIKAVLAKGNPSGFGYSDSTVSFFYPGGAWIRTLRFSGIYPNYEQIFARIDPKPKSLSDDFWQAFEAVAPFTIEDRLYLKAGKLQTHESENEGAQCDCFSMVNAGIINAKNMKQLKPLMQQVDFTTSPAYFVGDRVRGAFTKYG